MGSEREIAEGCKSASGKRVSAADRVSEAADRLFYARGIRAVGVEEIVAQAGVTKPSLYRNFTSKDELVASCLTARFDKVMGDIDRLEALFPDDPLQLLRVMIAGIDAEMREDEFRGCAVTNAAIEFPEEPHPVRTLALALKQRMRARLIGIVARLPTSRPEVLTDTLILLFEGARASHHTSGPMGPASALTAAADAMFAGFLDQPAGLNDSADPASL